MMPTVLRLPIAVLVLLVGVPSWAQYAEIPRALPGVGYANMFFPSPGRVLGAAQIGRRLFIGGSFTHISPPTGAAVVVTPEGQPVFGAFPQFLGEVSQIVPDTHGGWLVVGDFRSVDGQAASGFARITPERTVDPRYRVRTDGPIRFVALAHGRIYLAGQFTHVNGQRRGGLAALSAFTGRLDSWGERFDAGGRQIRALSISSIGVYLSAWSESGSLPPRLWGMHATSGRLLFARTILPTAIAASSDRVYVAGLGYPWPIAAVDPLTGEDTSWRPALVFEPQPGPYGEYTQINVMLLDGNRLYFAGRFGTADGHANLAAVDASTGAPSSWRPSGVSSYPIGLSRVGPAVVLTFASGRPSAYFVTTAALVDFSPQTFGYVRTVAAAPEGAVIGGSFTGMGGVARSALAAVDLDAYAIDPWTSALTMPGPLFSVKQVATDGTWLLVRTEDGRVAKIDPVSGAVVAEQAIAPGSADLTLMTVAGHEIVLVAYDPEPQLGLISIADWSYRLLPVTLGGPGFRWIRSLAVDGDTIYFAGSFQAVNGQDRPYLAAVDRSTGAVLPWRPAPDGPPQHVVAVDGRIWVGGAFGRVGGARRSGLAELDPLTGAALPWNPGAGNELYRLGVAPDGHLYAAFGVPSFCPGGWCVSTVGGQETPSLVAFSTSSGTRIPWQPAAAGLLALTPDCLVVTGGCLPRAVAPPTELGVTQVGPVVTLTWNLAGSPAVTGLRLEVGSRQSRADLYVFDLPATQTSFSRSAPSGSYFARVRALAGPATSPPSADVSFSAEDGRPAAPLDVVVIVDAELVTFSWRPPSTGAPLAYELEVGTAEGRRDIVLPIAGTATGFAAEAPAGLYWARLVSVNGSRRSAAGNELRFSVGPSQRCGGTPVAPVNLAASVDGRVVTLTWNPPPDGPQIDLQQVVVGSASLRWDLATFDVGMSATSFTTVAPPGTYFVAVVANNLCGTIAASNEVQVVVP